MYRVRVVQILFLGVVVGRVGMVTVLDSAARTLVCSSDYKGFEHIIAIYPIVIWSEFDCGGMVLLTVLSEFDEMGLFAVLSERYEMGLFTVLSECDGMV